MQLKTYIFINRILKKIWLVFTRLCKHLVAVRRLNKFESESNSICKQEKRYVNNNFSFSSKRTISAMHLISNDDHI